MAELVQDLLLPSAESTIASEVDGLFIFITLAGSLLIAGITAAIIYFSIRYRRRSDNDVTPLITHHNLLEITWSIIPLIIVLIVFSWGFKTFVKMTTPPDNAYEISVKAQKWLWRFNYANGASTVDTLHVPANKPIKLVMQSADVLHSFFVPEYRVKHDVIPNRYTNVWFEVMEPGESTIFCTEYCGLQHSGMTGVVVAHEQEEFDNWLARNEGGAMASDLPPAELGAKLFKENACNSCHSLDGSQMVGPTFKGLWERKEVMQNGEEIVADANYIRESILNPQAKIVKGYRPVMPPYLGQLNDDQIKALIEYIKTIK